MKNTFSITLFILPFLLLAQSPEKPDDFTFLDNISVKDIVYSLNSKINNRSFQLEVCTVSKCVKTQAFSKTMEADMLTRGLINYIQSNFDDTVVFDSVSQSEKEHIENLLELVKQKEFEDLEATKTDLERTLGEIDRDKNRYSGKLFIRKEIGYWVAAKPANKYSKNKFKDEEKEVKKTLKIIDAKVELFNNKATSIYIKAILEVNGKDQDTLIFLNNRFSVALRFFNYYGKKVSAQIKDKVWITIDFNDVFDYQSDQYYNYSVANDQISLSTASPDNMSAKVKQRHFFDYFTGIIYSDVLSFNTENSNSLLNAQAKLLLPLNLRNPGIFSFARQLSASVNVALSNSFSDETRYIAIKDDETFNHFDFLKKQNLNSKLDFQAINLEFKRLFMNISLGYSATFYRTGFRYTQTGVDSEDIITNRQLLSLGHGPFLNFEIRPQSNFGADLVVSFEDLNYNDSESINDRNFRNDIIDDGGHNHFGFKHNMVNVEANFYWLTSDDKTGGVYAKIGSYYHTESNEIFPQIMVGYATNLTSFVNRFNPKKKGVN